MTLQPEHPMAQGIHIPAEELPLALLVIDPMLLTRGCLIAAIQGADPHASIIGIGSIDEDLQQLQNGRAFDAVLVNLPPGGRSSEALAGNIAPIRAAFPDSAIVLLAGSSEQSHIAAAFRHGVRGYLPAETRLATTIDAIRLICAGWAVHPPLNGHGTEEGEARSAQHRAALSGLLTSRQLQVLDLLATGMPNKSIAFELKMSERTVKAHVKAIMQRMGAINRTQVVARLARTAS